MHTFDIFGQIAKEIKSFEQDYIHIAGVKGDDSNRYLQKGNNGYQFSQYQLLNIIDLYYNSKFETGEIDSEGQRKLFLNICAFRADVASKMVDLDTKDFVFIPDNSDSKWGAFFIQKEFKDWAKRNYLGELINDTVENYPKYGTVVIKKCGKTLERVPLRNLYNQQDAKDLQSARFVIEIHRDMTLDEMNEYPDWDTSGLDLDYGKTTTVYERYGTVPLKFYNEYVGKSTPDSQDDENIDVVCICTLTPKEEGQKGDTGTILYMEKITERPYLEVHWKKQDGRWLGIGEVENQLENQISRNMIANLRRRALLWSSKKVFQSPDDTLPKNLVRNVKDGDVIRIMPNGNITQVDMSSREIGEFQSTEEIWEKNSDQKSFTYESATGESMPSGTPFRLGVILSNAVNSHFGMKKEKLGLFWKRIITEFVFDIFKKENSKKHTLTMFGTEKGINDLRALAVDIEMNKRLTDWAMGETDKVYDWEAVKKGLQDTYQNKSHLFVEIPDSFYDDIKHHIELVITGEEIDVASDISSLTTLYQTMLQSGDPRAEQVLQEIFALRGKNLEAMIGKKPEPQPQQQMPQQAQQPQLPTNQPQAPQQL